MRIGSRNIGWVMVHGEPQASGSLAPSRWKTASLAGAFLITGAQPAHAHPSGLQAGDAWWLAWHFDPWVVFSLTVLTLVYAGGLNRLWRRAGKGRVISWARATAFGASLLAVVLALLSPLDTLSDDLGWVHMLQHMMLMVVAAPLFMAGSPGLAAAWALPKPWRWWRRGGWGRPSARLRQLGHRLSWNPLVAWSLHAIVLWVWHVPVLYELALINPVVHDAEHLSFFLVACLFWRLTLDSRHQPTLNPGLSVLYLFTTSLHAMVLGVLMALSPRVWYPLYVGRTERWGLSALEDQQLAGLIMWMPACLVYAVVAAILFAHWLESFERPAAEAERLSEATGRPQGKPLEEAAT